MYKLVVTLVAITAGARAQTQVDLRTQSKSMDFGAATSTRPFQTGTALPATCAVGNVFFKTNATAGSNVYGCTATNTWAVESGGGSGNPITHGQVIAGSADEVQLDITGNTTQTNPIFRVRTSSGANLIQANNDGSVNIGSGTGPEITVEQAAPSGFPASGTEWIWSDSSGAFLRQENAAGATFQMAREITGLRFANGAGLADTPATAAKITGLFAGCSGTMSLGADGNCHAGGASTFPDFSTRNGYDDFCGNDAGAASGFSLFSSKMRYSNVGGNALGNSVTPCGVTMTTTASTGATSSFALSPELFTLIPATQVFTLEVVFKTSDATNASFSFSTGSDNNIARGSSNGIAIQALASGANITLETCSGFSCTSTSSGVSYAANTVYKAKMRTDGAGNACIQVNAGSEVCTGSNVTSTLSADTGLVWGVKTASATAVTATVLGWAYSIPGF